MYTTASVTDSTVSSRPRAAAPEQAASDAAERYQTGERRHTSKTAVPPVLPRTFWGNSWLTFAISPIPLEEGAGISQALSLATVHPLDQTKGTLLCKVESESCQLIMSLLFTP